MLNNQQTAAPFTMVGWKRARFRERGCCIIIICGRELNIEYGMSSTLK